MSVQEDFMNISKRIKENFNTSYVSVQVNRLNEIKQMEKNFNTSYVSVQVVLAIVTIYVLCISIHRMCRFK